MKQILLISDNPEFIEDLTEQVAKHIEGFEITTNTNKPDMIIIDEDQEKLKGYPKIPSILLTSKEHEDSLPFKGGLGRVSLSKPFRLNDFFKNLQSIIQRFENTSEGFLSFNQFELRPNTKEIINLRNNELIKLTEREVSILKYLHKHQNEIISKNDLLEDVWGYNIESATHTIETHIYRLRQKIEHEDQSSQIIETIDGGYKLII